jgi:hypothetical protein
MPNGYTFRMEGDGRFYPIPPDGSLSNGTVVVTGGAPDQHAAALALARGAAMPVPSNRWTVSYEALAAAIAGGTRAVLSTY